MPTHNAIAELLPTLTTHLVEVGYTVCDPRWAEAGLYNDPFGRIYWVEQGEGWVVHHAQRYALTPGRLYVIPEHTPSRYGCPCEMRLYWLHFTAHVLQQIDLFAFLNGGFTADVVDDTWITPAWQRLLHTARSSPPGAPITCDGILRELIAPFINQSTEHEQRHRITGVARFQQVFAYIEQHLPTRLTLEELAHVAGLHPTYFSNLFAKHMGIAPMNYVNRRRVERARLLLLTTPQSLQQIAAEVGFCDEYYFSRVFKRYTQMTPGRYRAQHRQLRP